MRPKIVITVLLAGVAGLAIIFFLKPPANRPQAEVVPIAQPATAALETKPAVTQVIPVTNEPVVATPSKPENAAPVVTAEVVGEDAAHIQETIDRLEELQANDDDASLQAILKELTNTNRIIRHVAIEATIQFGGHTAVPVLQDLAARTSDPGEKKELLDAAEFLTLPSWTEAKAEDAKAKMNQPPIPSPTPDEP